MREIWMYFVRTDPRYDGRRGRVSSPAVPFEVRDIRRGFVVFLSYYLYYWES